MQDDSKEHVARVFSLWCRELVAVEGLQLGASWESVGDEKGMDISQDAPSRAMNPAEQLPDVSEINSLTSRKGSRRLTCLDVLRSRGGRGSNQRNTTEMACRSWQGSRHGLS